jgi:hypothetical protein
MNIDGLDRFQSLPMASKRMASGVVLQAAGNDLFIDVTLYLAAGGRGHRIHSTSSCRLSCPPGPLPVPRVAYDHTATDPRANGWGHASPWLVPPDHSEDDYGEGLYKSRRSDPSMRTYGLRGGPYGTALRNRTYSPAVRASRSRNGYVLKCGPVGVSELQASIRGGDPGSASRLQRAASAADRHPSRLRSDASAAVAEVG